MGLRCNHAVSTVRARASHSQHAPSFDLSSCIKLGDRFMEWVWEREPFQWLGPPATAIILTAVPPESADSECEFGRVSPPLRWHAVDARSRSTTWSWQALVELGTAAAKSSCARQQRVEKLHKRERRRTASAPPRCARRVHLVRDQTARGAARSKEIERGVRHDPGHNAAQLLARARDIPDRRFRQTREHSEHHK